MKPQIQKNRVKKSFKFHEVELDEDAIDKGYDTIFRIKTTKYNGRLGGDKEFLNPSDEPSEDSD